MISSSPSFTNIQGLMSDEFDRLCRQARRAVLLAKLFGKHRLLKKLSDAAPPDLQNKRYAGVQSISISRIVGSVSRDDDFDTDFRPRKKHLRNRWINMFILHDSSGWPPILVHQVGDEYYVEDGHHRVSVARFIGMEFIEAEVWDHHSPAVATASDLASRRFISSGVQPGAADYCLSCREYPTTP